jgi:hypothetical protein
MNRSSVAIRVTSDQGTWPDGLHSFRVRSQRERDDLPRDDAAGVGQRGEFLDARSVSRASTSARSTSFST